MAFVIAFGWLLSCFLVCAIFGVAVVHRRGLVSRGDLQSRTLDLGSEDLEDARECERGVKVEGFRNEEEVRGTRRETRRK